MMGIATISPHLPKRISSPSDFISAIQPPTPINSQMHPKTINITNAESCILINHKLEDIKQYGCFGKNQRQQALKKQGCSSFDDVDFILRSNVYKIDDAICNDGKKYDIILDNNFTIVIRFDC